MKNIDKIKQMNAEELSEFIVAITDNSVTSWLNDNLYMDFCHDCNKRHGNNCLEDLGIVVHMMIST